MVYLVVVIGLMLIAPAASIHVEHRAGGELIALTAKWFVFWAIGLRLLLAGIAQVLHPSFTAVSIFRIADKAAEKLVSEIGFANLAIGTIAALSLLFPAWLVPAGVAGSIFLGLAGLKHVANLARDWKETLAMVSDLFVAVVVALALAARWM
jgi:hypothetical protein